MLELFNAHPEPFYGALVAVSLVLAALSRSEPVQKTTLLLLVAWVGCNLTEAIFHYGAATASLLAMMDAALCIGTLRVAWGGWHRFGLIVAGLYWVAITLWMVSIYQRTPDGPLWYVATNGVFFVQVVIAGAVGGRLAYMAHSRHRRDVRFRAPVRGL